MSASTPRFTLASAPPYRLHTKRLVLRCLEPGDAERRMEAVDSSGEHLAHFFPPAEMVPPFLDFHAAQIRKSRGSFDLDQDRAYGAFEPGSGKMVGEGFLLKRAGLQALEVGYWLRRDAVGQGLATEIAGALVKVAFERDAVKRMDLMCDPDNARSAAVARRLGFTLEGRLRERQLSSYHTRGDLLCFTLLPGEYPRTIASQLELEAFDFLGRRIS